MLCVMTTVSNVHNILHLDSTLKLAHSFEHDLRQKYNGSGARVQDGSPEATSSTKVVQSTVEHCTVIHWCLQIQPPSASAGRSLLMMCMERVCKVCTDAGESHLFAQV